MLTALSVDRVMALWRPIAYKLHSKPRIAAITLITAVTAISIIALPALDICDIKGGECSTNQETDMLSNHMVIVYLLFIMGLMSLVVPCLTIIVCSCLIIHKVRRVSGKKGIFLREFFLTIFFSLVFSYN